MMTLNQLQYFVAAAENRSFTKAASLYYISQTAITQQIRSLEETVGCRLFDRSTRPLSLTPAGYIFLNEARAILERANTAVLRTREASVGMSGNLHIGYTKGYERSDLSEHLRAFHNRYPNIMLNCYRDSTDNLASRLLADDLDLIYSWDSTNLCTDKRIDYKLVERVRLVVVMYPGHPLALRKSLTREELRHEPIMFMSPSDLADSYGDAHFMELYQKAGYRPDIIFRSSDAESILIMIAAEEGISIIPEYIVSKLENADNLVYIPLIGDEEFEEIVAIWKKDNNNPALRQYLSERK